MRSLSFFSTIPPQNLFEDLTGNNNHEDLFLTISLSSAISRYLQPIIVFFHIFRGSHWRCSSKKVFLKYLQDSQKTPVLESLFNKIADLGGLTRSFFNRVPPVAAFSNNREKIILVHWSKPAATSHYDFKDLYIYIYIYIYTYIYIYIKYIHT